MTDWKRKLQSVGALWWHDGDPKHPHALLTSGKHCDGYCNGTKLVERPTLLAEVVTGMIENTREYLGGEVPDVIMGPAMGAITIGHEWARQLDTLFAFTEPVFNEGDIKKGQELKRFEIPEGSKVLVVEDMVTTGGSIQKTIDTLAGLDVHIYPFVPIIVDRSKNNPESLDSRYSVVPLVSVNVTVWEPDECELCVAGSEAVRPKSHWNLLTA
jgi:orotate phosphoribosyltransferase